MTDAFSINTDVLQGDPLAPFLFTFSVWIMHWGVQYL